MADMIWRTLEGATAAQLLDGRPVRETFHGLPILERTYTPMEKDSDHGIAWREWAAEHWEVPLVAIAVYLAFIKIGPRLMKQREAFSLRGPLILWNLGLCTFSAIGAFRTMPHLMYNLASFDFRDTVCRPAPEMYGSGVCGLWVALFIFSKIPELVDTVFIVLRKRKLIFLHWYHHVTVLLYCWLAYSSQAASGIYFVAMNYSVHAIMYGYYAMAACKMVPTWFPTHLITVAQISQMFVGVGICMATIVFGREGSCNNTPASQIAGALMYASYFYLFVDFAVKRFLLQPSRKGVKKLA